MYLDFLSFGIYFEILTQWRWMLLPILLSHSRFRYELHTFCWNLFAFRLKILTNILYIDMCIYFIVSYLLWNTSAIVIILFNIFFSYRMGLPFDKLICQDKIIPTMYTLSLWNHLPSAWKLWQAFSISIHLNICLSVFNVHYWHNFIQYYWIFILHPSFFGQTASLVNMKSTQVKSNMLWNNSFRLLHSFPLKNRTREVILFYIVIEEIIWKSFCK